MSCACPPIAILILSLLRPLQPRTQRVTKVTEHRDPQRKVFCPLCKPLWPLCSVSSVNLRVLVRLAPSTAVTIAPIAPRRKVFCPLWQAFVAFVFRVLCQPLCPCQARSFHRSNHRSNRDTPADAMTTTIASTVIPAKTPVVSNGPSACAMTYPSPCVAPRYSPTTAPTIANPRLVCRLEKIQVSALGISTCRTS